VQDGSITLIDEQGTEHVFNTGDTFFIPEAVLCKATIVASVRLFFTVVKSAWLNWYKTEPHPFIEIEIQNVQTP